MKKIALTSRIIEYGPYREVQESLDIRWCSLLEDLGFLPVVIPVEARALEEYLSRELVTGVIFSGGNDLGMINDNLLSRKRDAFEQRVFDICLKNNFPVLGVCRGMQFIAHYFGATFMSIKGHAGCYHDVHYSRSFPVKRFCNTTEEKNSYHHYTIRDLPPCLDTIASCSDGTIEGLIHKRHSNVVGIMWHPERMQKHASSDRQLIQRLFE